MKRKKRLEKGIQSIEEEIEFHEEKREKAIQEGNFELAGYQKNDALQALVFGRIRNATIQHF